jgi:hypothetical protein
MEKVPNKQICSCCNERKVKARMMCPRCYLGRWRKKWRSLNPKPERPVKQRIQDYELRALVNDLERERSDYQNAVGWQARIRLRKRIDEIGQALERMRGKTGT